LEISKGGRIIILLAILTILGTTVYTYMKVVAPPEIQVPVAKNTTRVINIGVFSSTDSNYPIYKFLSEQAVKDFNEYCNKTGVDARLNVTLGNAMGIPGNALEFTQQCNKTGIKMIVGFGWSSFFCSGAYGYANNSGIILFSPSSTSPTYNIKDHVFRFCGVDIYPMSKIITKILEEKGVESLIVLRRGDSWSDGFINIFKADYEQTGGSIISEARYVAEVWKFDEYLSEIQPVLEEAVEKNGVERVGILIAAFDETVNILSDAGKYPSLLNVTWYGTDGTANLKTIPEKAPEEAIRVGLISTIPTDIETKALNNITTLWLSTEEYKKAGGPSKIGFYDANIYDCIMVGALSALKVPSLDFESLKLVIPTVAADYNGLTGKVLLDEYGDRTGLNYDIWGYFKVNGECKAAICGQYSAAADEISWNLTLQIP
jgi:branched-chain amino acid transport system substrate-binding protein